MIINNNIKTIIVDMLPINFTIGKHRKDFLKN